MDDRTRQREQERQREKLRQREFENTRKKERDDKRKAQQLLRKQQQDVLKKKMKAQRLKALQLKKLAAANAPKKPNAIAGFFKKAFKGTMSEERQAILAAQQVERKERLRRLSKGIAPTDASALPTDDVAIATPNANDTPRVNPNSKDKPPLDKGYF